MLTIHYFASIREQLNRSEERLEMPESVTTVDDLVEHLLTAAPQEMSILSDQSKVLVAVNQTIVDRSTALVGTEEIAFFPHMTGG